MGNVTFTIDGRSYALACADGEEAHLLNAARVIDSKAAQAGAVGQTEARMLLYAALMLADELMELRARPPEQVVSAPPLPDMQPDIPDELAQRLGRIAQHVENLAEWLESDAQSA